MKIDFNAYSKPALVDLLYTLEAGKVFSLFTVDIPKFLAVAEAHHTLNASAAAYERVSAELNAELARSERILQRAAKAGRTTIVALANEMEAIKENVARLRRKRTLAANRNQQAQEVITRLAPELAHSYVHPLSTEEPS